MPDLVKIIEELRSIQVEPDKTIVRNFGKEGDDLTTKRENLEEEYEARTQSILVEEANLQTKMFKYFLELLKKKYGKKISIMVAAEKYNSEDERATENICSFKNFVEPEDLELKPEDYFIFIAVTIEDTVLSNQVHDSTRSFLKSDGFFIPLTNLFRMIIQNIHPFPATYQSLIEEMEKWIIRMIDIK